MQTSLSPYKQQRLQMSSEMRQIWCLSCMSARGRGSALRPLFFAWLSKLLMPSYLLEEALPKLRESALKFAFTCPGRLFSPKDGKAAETLPGSVLDSPVSSLLVRRPCGRNPSRSYILRHDHGHVSELGIVLSFSSIVFDGVHWTQVPSNLPAVSVDPLPTISTSSTFTRICEVDGL